MREIENKAHAAVHAKSYGKVKPLCAAIYVIEASDQGGVIGVTIRLTGTSAELARTYGAGSPKAIATACQNAVSAGVTEVGAVTVVDQSGATLTSFTR